MTQPVALTPSSSHGVYMCNSIPVILAAPSNFNLLGAAFEGSSGYVACGAVLVMVGAGFTFSMFWAWFLDLSSGVIVRFAIFC